MNDECHKSSKRNSEAVLFVSKNCDETSAFQHISLKACTALPAGATLRSRSMFKLASGKTLQSQGVESKLFINKSASIQLCFVVLLCFLVRPGRLRKVSYKAKKRSKEGTRSI